jgi:predicted kinase
MPTVYMMLGLPGSGKTTFSNQLEKERGIAMFSLDREYSRLGGDLTSNKWDERIAGEAGDLIKSRVKDLVSQNKSVILDFCPWKKDDRLAYRKFIESIGANCHVYYFDLPVNELRSRLSNRNSNPGGGDHIITPDMLDAFVTRFDPPLDEQYESVQA